MVRTIHFNSTAVELRRSFLSTAGFSRLSLSLFSSSSSLFTSCIDRVDFSAHRFFTDIYTAEPKSPAVTSYKILRSLENIKECNYQNEMIISRKKKNRKKKSMYRGRRRGRGIGRARARVLLLHSTWALPVYESLAVGRLGGDAQNRCDMISDQTRETKRSIPNNHHTNEYLPNYSFFHPICLPLLV